jgi:hypothetical protein
MKSRFPKKRASRVRRDGGLNGDRTWELDATGQMEKYLIVGNINDKQGTTRPGHSR